MRFHTVFFMAKITVSIPKELCDKMKGHPEIRWSEVIGKALTEYIARFEIVEGAVVSSEKLAAKLKDAGLDVSDIDLDKAVEYFEKASRKETRRMRSLSLSQV
jgi:hypothetical protein